MHAETADDVEGGDSNSTAYAILDSDLENTGCQGGFSVKNIGDNEKIGFAVYVKNCVSINRFTIDLTWDGALASYRRFPSGPHIPDEQIDINDSTGILLAEERNMLVRDGGELLSVVTAHEYGHYAVTYGKIGNETVLAAEGLLCFAVFKTASDFNISDSLSIQVSVTLWDEHGNSRLLEPLTFTAESLRPGITVISPNGGDELIAGDIFDITWTAVKVDSVMLEYSPDDGEIWYGITRAIDASESSFIWTVPDRESSSCLIRITDTTESTIVDVSDEHFTIWKAPEVSITLPEGEQTTAVPVEYHIIDPYNRPVTLRVEYSTDEGNTWIVATTEGTISAISPEDYEGNFLWKANEDLPGYEGIVQLSIASDIGKEGLSVIEEVHVDYNLPPELEIETIEGVVSGYVSLQYAIHDDEGNPVSINLLYSIDSGETWTEATVTGKTSDIEPEDYTGIITWDSRADLPGQDHPAIRVRVTACDKDAGGAVDMEPLHVDNSVTPGEGTIDKFNPGEIAVLVLHNVVSSEEDKSRYSLTPKMFERLIEELSYAGYHFLSTHEYLDYIIHGTAVPENSVYLNFDDGFYGVYQNAFPLLKKHAIHACVNLIASRIYTSFFLGINQIRELHDSGLVDFQSHSFSLHHYWEGEPAILQRSNETDRVYKERIIRDLKVSNKYINDITGETAVSFVLPFGVGNDTVIECAKEAGFNAVFFSATDKIHTYGDNPYHLERIGVYRFNAKVIPKLLLCDHFSKQSDMAKQPVPSVEIIDGADVNIRFASQMDGGIIHSSPAIGSDGTIYIGSWDNCLYAVNPDGTHKWKYTTESGISSSPAVDADGTIYVGSYDRFVYALNSNGTLKWKFETWDPVFSSPAVDGEGTIYIGSTDGFFFAISPDGSCKWRFRTGDMILSSPAIGKDGSIYIGSSDAHVYAFNPDGALQWKFSAGDIIESSPAIGQDGTIYVGCCDNHVYAINPDGSLKWQYRTGSWVDSSPSTGRDGTIYVGCWDTYLYAINTDGTLQWRFRTGARIVSSPAVGRDGTIYVGSWDNYLYAVNPDGTLKWRVKTGGGIDSSPALADDGTIYVGSLDSRVYGIDSGTNAGLIPGPWPKFKSNRSGTARVPENIPPVILTASLHNATAGETYVDTLIVKDPDENDAFSFEILEGPEWLTIDNGGILGGVPTGNDVGVELPVSIKAVDSFGQSDTLYTTMTVISSGIAERWEMKLIFAENNTVVDSLECGMAPSATDTIDEMFGESELSPRPPEGFFDVRFTGENLGNGVKKDIRKSTDEQINYVIDLQRASAGEITVSWSTPPDGTFILQDMFGGMVFRVNMASIREITIRDKNINQLQIIAVFEPGEPVIKPPSNLRFSDILGGPIRALKLTWNASPSEEEGLVSRYRIYRSRSHVRTDPIPLSWFSSNYSLNSWDWHYTILIDSVAAGITEYCDINVPLREASYYYWVEAVGEYGASKKATFGNIMLGENKPSEFKLNLPYPNPFNPSTTFRYSVPEECHVSLVIYDILGRKVALVKDEIIGTGNHATKWFGISDNGTAVGSGIYLYQFTAGNYHKKGKIMLMR